ncbi:MAG: thioredoxin [Clostridia bacterium]|mgnify:CR=1 FL=1|nr:thioredoxin [Clostridia bacterium]
MEIKASDFEAEVINSKIPVLVDFYADWCGPCRMLAPVLGEFEKKHTGEVKLCKVNIDREPQLAARFNVMSIPTLIVFRGGSAVNQSVGYISADEVEKLVF